MTGQLFINGRDAWLTWGVFLIGDSLDNLLLPASPKSYTENNFRSQDGKQVFIVNTKKDARDVQIEFCIKAETREGYLLTYKNFVEELSEGVVNMSIPFIGMEFKLTVSSYLSLGYYDKFGKLSVRFNEPFAVPVVIKDYLRILGIITDQVTGIGLEDVDVKFEAPEGTPIGDGKTNDRGAISIKWPVSKEGYEALLPLKTKIGAHMPSYVRTNVANPLHTANQTILCWFRTAPADAPGGFGSVIRQTNGQSGIPYIALYSSPDSTQKRGCTASVNFGGTSLSFGYQPYDADLIMALRRNAAGEVSAFLFGQKLSGTTGSTRGDDRTFSIGTRETTSLLYQHYGNVYGAHVYNTALSDAEIYDKMYSRSSSGAVAVFSPDGLTDSAWTSQDGAIVLSKFQPTAEILYQGQLKTLFSKEGYIDEIRYVELPDFETAINGIALSQAMCSNADFNAKPTTFVMPGIGGVQDVIVTSPWPILGVIPRANWLTASISGNTVTIKGAANTSSIVRSGAIAIFTGEKTKTIVVVQGIASSYYVDVDGKTHYFTPDNTPFANFIDPTGLTTTVTLGGVEVVKDDIVELSFGTRYDGLVPAVIHNFFVCNYPNLEILTLPDMSGVTQLGNNPATDSSYVLARNPKLGEIVRIETLERANVTGVGGMFMYQNAALAGSLDLSNWKLRSSPLSYFLYGTTALSSIKLPYLTEPIAGGAYMGYLWGVTKIDLTPWANLTSVSNPFCAYLANVTTLDLSPLQNLTSVNSNFARNNTSLKSIIIGNKDWSGVTLSGAGHFANNPATGTIYADTPTLGESFKAKFPALSGWAVVIGRPE